MAIKVDIKEAISDYVKKGGSTNFRDSLSDILRYAKNDNNLKKIQHLAYLLATAKAESDYSLTRWESDYLCGGEGVPYKNRPCDKALSYYKSSDGKKNYYDLGVDRNGLPYFGRGLIQLTGKSNYDKYGKIIGVDILSNGDLALESKNSYKIASAYLNDKRGSSKKSTFDYVDDNNLTQARISVNGGTKSLNLVNDTYYFWLPILKKHGKVIDNNLTKKILGYTVLIATIGITGIIIYQILKKSNKLPNFINKS